MGSKGRESIPLHNAEEALRKKVDEQGEPAPGDGKIELDTSPQAQGLPVTEFDPHERLELHTIELDKSAEEAESYETMKELYLTVQLSPADIQEIFIDDKSSSFYNTVELVGVASGSSASQRPKGQRFISPDRAAAQRLMEEINQGKLRVPTLVWRPEPGSQPERKPEGKRWADLHAPKSVEQAVTEKEHEVDSSEFQFLDNLYIQGMELKDMRRMFLVGKEKRERLVEEEFSGAPPELKQMLLSTAWHDAAENYFSNYIDKGYKPGAQFVSKLLFKQPGLIYEQLNAPDKAEAEQQFVKVSQEQIKDFVYSGRWWYNRDKGEYEVSPEADLDAKVSLFLFQRAGFKGALPEQAQALPHGQMKPGAGHVDIGYQWGVKALDDGTWVLDTHQTWHAPVESSTAKISYRLLTEGGFIKDSATLRQLAELTVADDNGNLITNREQFNKSDRTLRGLHRFFEAGQLYGYVQQHWHQEYDKWTKAKAVAAELGQSKGELPKELKDQVHELMRFYGASDEEIQNSNLNMLWRNKLADIARVGSEQRGKGGKPLGVFIYERLLDREFTDQEIQQLGLEKGYENQHQTIATAKELFFDKTPEQLIEEGRVIKTTSGEAVLHVEGVSKKLKGGHDVVVAAEKGYAMFLAMDPAARSILMNTTDHGVDMSVQYKDLLEKYPQLKAVRGGLIIKPKNGEEIVDSEGKQVEFYAFTKDVLAHITDAKTFEPKGYVKELLRRAEPRVPRERKQRTQAPAKDRALTPPAQPRVSTAYGDAWSAVNLLGKKNVSAEENRRAQHALRTLGYTGELVTRKIQAGVTPPAEQRTDTPPPSASVAEVAVSVEPTEPSTQPKSVSEEPPLVEHGLPKAEGWVDETGIRFTRELSSEELEAKQKIDDKFRQVLSEVWQERLANAASTEITALVAEDIKSGKIVAARRERYRNGSLPTVQ